MKLIKADIRNYRSIEDISIDFDFNTKVFVGLSESGKSNLLKALSTLDPSYKTNPYDIREDDDSEEKAVITFKMMLDSGDKENIINKVVENFYAVDRSDLCIGKVDYLEKILERTFLCDIDIEKNTRIYKGYVLGDATRFSENIFLLEASSTTPITITDPDGENQVITSKILLNRNAYTISNEEALKPLDAEKLNSFVIENVRIYLRENPFKVLFWKYDEKNILPSEISTEEFINNPDICLPLKKIFELSSITDIKEEYDKKKARGTHSFENSLDRISKKITSFLKAKWDSMPKGAEIIISESGDKLRVAVKEEKKYDMAARSDGYKRLVSFMILISIDNSNEKLKDTVLLIDCPEAEIDVPSQKYLRDELIEIGKNNYVFYATHSPYMIDSNNTYRHYLVKKEKEVTSIEIGEEADYNDSVIIFNALGTSLFENIADLNIAFEGWTDKQLYNSGIKLLTAAKKKKIEKIGICHIGGLRNAKSFASTWQIICKIKKYVIVSDSDNAKDQIKNEFLEANLNDNVDWLDYDAMGSFGRKIQTAEDFLTVTRIKSICDIYAKANEMTEIDESKLSNDSKAKIDIIDNWLKTKYDDKEFKIEKKKIKESLFTKLQKNHIRDDYKIVLDKIIDIS